MLSYKTLKIAMAIKYICEVINKVYVAIYR